MREAESEHRRAQEAGDAKRYAEAKALLAALEQAAILLTVQEPIA